MLNAQIYLFINLSLMLHDHFWLAEGKGAGSVTD